jgi:hypothetical protein
MAKSTIFATAISSLMAVCNFQMAAASPALNRAIVKRVDIGPLYSELYVNQSAENQQFDLVDQNNKKINKRTTDSEQRKLMQQGSKFIHMA